MKIIITFLTGFLCLVVPLLAQDDAPISELFAQNEFSSNSDNDLLFVCRASLNEASKQEEWESGILIDYKNKAHRVEGHYNAVTDEMQILLKDQSRTLFPQKIKAIKVGEMIFVPVEYKGSEALNYGYFQVLSSNVIDLLMKFEEKDGSISKSYYTHKKDEAAKELDLKKSSIVKELNDKRTAKYLKEKQLNVKKEQDLVELFDYHNSLFKK